MNQQLKEKLISILKALGIYPETNHGKIELTIRDGEPIHSETRTSKKLN